MKATFRAGLLLLAVGCATEPVAGPRPTPDALVAARPIAYSLTDISTGPYDDSYAQSINDANEVVGWSNVPGSTTHGWAWVGGRVVWLKEPSWATGSAAYGISPDGRIVGTIFSSPVSSTAVYWASRTASPQAIPTISGTGSNEAHGVNANGRVVGYLTDASGTRQGFSWEANTGRFGLMGTLGGPGSDATDVNANGVATGCADGPTGRRIFRWSSASGMVLGDTYSGSKGSCGFGINRLQNVAGYFFGGGGSDTAAVFDATGFPPATYRLGSSNTAWLAVNDNGVAAGYADQPVGGVVQGVALNPGRGLSLLPSYRAGAEARAFDINLCGRIVGWGYSSAEGGSIRALLWIPPGC